MTPPRQRQNNLSGVHSFLRYLALIWSFLFCCFAFADATTESSNDTTVVGLHLASIHSATGYNDLNPGAYVEFSNNLTLGHYYNSNYKESTYIAYTYGYNSNIDLTIGFTTGYQLYRYTPLLVPSYKIRKLLG